MAETKLTAVIEAEDKASAVIAKVGKSAEGLGKKVESLKPMFKTLSVVGIAAFGALSGVAISSLKEFADSQKKATIANATLENSLKNMSKDAVEKLALSLGGHSGLIGAMNGLKDQMYEVGKAALNLGFDDDVARLAFAKLFQVSGSVTQAQKDMKLAMDLSAFSGKDLSESAAAITKVHAGATKILKDFGIEVDKNATSQDALNIIQEKTAGVALKVSETVEGQMNKLREQFNNLKEAIGGALAPALTDLLKQITPIVQKFVDWANAHPDLIAKIIKLGIQASIAAVGIGAIGLFLPSLIEGFALLTSPLGLVVTAITVLTVLAIVFKDRWKEILAFIEERIPIVELLKIAWDNIVQTFRDFLLPALQELWEALIPLKPFLEAMAKVAGVTFVGGVVLLIKAVEGWIEIFIVLITIATKVAKFFTDVFVGAINGVISVVEKALKLVTNLIEKIKQLNIIQGAKNVGSGIVGGLTNFGHALGFAEGGIVTKPTLAMIGEGGESEAVIPLSKLGSMGGGRDVNINISGAILTEDAARVMGDMIISKLRLQLKF